MIHIIFIILCLHILDIILMTIPEPYHFFHPSYPGVKNRIPDPDPEPWILVRSGSVAATGLPPPFRLLRSGEQLLSISGAVRTVHDGGFPMEPCRPLDQWQPTQLDQWQPTWLDQWQPIWWYVGLCRPCRNIPAALIRCGNQFLLLYVVNLTSFNGTVLRDRFRKC